MRVFVTGATGFIGSAVVAELRGAGHDVLALARSDAAAGALSQDGVEVHRGTLTDVESLAAGAGACDGVAHLAFIHDFSRYQENGEIDTRAVSAMARALDGSGKPLVITSGTTTVAAPGRTVTEDDPATYDSPSAVRARSEEVVLQAAATGVRSSVVRLPPSVHGQGDHGFVPMLIDIARRTGMSAYVNEGANQWPAVHRLDTARLFRLALEKGLPGARNHGVGEEGVAMREIADAIAEGLNVPSRSIPLDAAPAHFGWLAHFVVLDVPASSVLTQERLGWLPRENELLLDLRESGYFA